MKITDFIKKDSIALNVEASQKEEVIQKAVELMSKNGNLIHKEEYFKLL